MDATQTFSLKKSNLGRRAIIRASVVAVLATVALGTSLPNLWYLFYPMYGEFGFCTDADYKVTCVQSKAAKTAGLHVGDSIDYRSMPLQDRYGAYSDRLPPAGTKVRFKVVHAGIERRVSLVALHDPSHWPHGYYLGLLVAKKVATLLLVMLAGALLLVRPARITWVLFLFAVGSTYSGPHYYSFLEPGRFLAINMLSNLLWYLGPVAFLAFACALPDDASRGWRRAGLAYFPLLYVSLAALSIWTDIRGVVFAYGVQSLFILGETARGLCFLLGIAALGTMVARGTWQPGLKWVVSGLVLGALGPIVAVAINLFPVLPLHLPMWSFEASFFIGMAASIASGYFIVRHRIIDVRFVFNRALLYAALSGVLMAALVGANIVFGPALAATRVVLPLELIAAIAGGFWLSGLFELARTVSLIDVEAPLALTRGQWNAERDIVGRALLSAERIRAHSLVAAVRARAGFDAWFVGRDAEFETHVDKLAEALEHKPHRDLEFFVSCARGVAQRSSPANELPEWVAAGYLIASGNADDIMQANEYAQAAYAAATDAVPAWIRAIACVTLAESSAERRPALYEEAVTLSNAVDSTQLRSAVQALAAGRGHLGVLGPFVNQRLRHIRRAKPVLQVSFLTGGVRSHGADVELRDKGLGVLLTVARARGQIGSEELADRLWPDLDALAARNALKACVYRLRQSLHDDRALSRAGDAYRLREGAVADLWDIEDSIVAMRRKGIDDKQRRWLRDALPDMRRGRPALLTKQPWFEDIERYLRELTHEAAELFAKDALRRGDTAEALAIGRDMVRDDPCDEPAREIVVRALQASGNATAVMHEYKSYCEALARELQTHPSPAFQALFEDGDSVRTSNLRA